MIITDEMVERAARAIVESGSGWFRHMPDGTQVPIPTDETWQGSAKDARAALEAVAPMLIAQGMTEAAFIAYCEGQIVTGDRIRARAQELDPK